MIGVCVIFSDLAASAKAVGPERELLGAALVARAVAATCPAERDIRAVVAVPAGAVDQVRDEILQRYGLVEVVETIALGSSFAETLRQGVEALGEEPALIVVHDGRRPLVSHELTLRVMDAAAARGAAALALEASSGLVQTDEEGLLMPLAEQGRVLQTPQAAKRDLVLRALEAPPEQARDLFGLLAAAEIPVAAVDGDRDNLPVIEEADVTRVVEVWSRRAVEYPFLWPRPDRAEEPDAEEGEPEAEGAVAPSAAMDEMLAGGADDAERAGPLDQAIATLTEQDAEPEDRGPAHDAADVE